MDHFLTLKRAKIGPMFNFTTYIYRERVKNWPKIGGFLC